MQSFLELMSSLVQQPNWFTWLLLWASLASTALYFYGSIDKTTLLIATIVLAPRIVLTAATLLGMVVCLFPIAFIVAWMCIIVFQLTPPMIEWYFLMAAFMAWGFRFYGLNPSMDGDQSDVSATNRLFYGKYNAATMITAMLGLFSLSTIYGVVPDWRYWEFFEVPTPKSELSMDTPINISNCRGALAVTWIVSTLIFSFRSFWLRLTATKCERALIDNDRAGGWLGAVVALLVRPEYWLSDSYQQQLRFGILQNQQTFWVLLALIHNLD